MKTHKYPTRAVALLLLLAVAAAAAYWFNILHFDVGSVPMSLAVVAAADWNRLVESLGGIEGKLSRLPELAERVHALEQKSFSEPPPADVKSRPAAGAVDRSIDGLSLLRKSADFRSYYGADGAADYVPLPELLRGIAGMKTTERATKALSVGTDTAGGFAVPRATFGQVMSALAPVSGLLTAGVPVVPVGDAKSVTTAVVNALPNAAWREEAGAIAESDPTFRGVVATPRSLSFRFKVSRELLADAPNIGQALELVVSQAMAKAMDRAGLRGSGTAPEPRGLRNTSGVQIFSLEGVAGARHSMIAATIDNLLGVDAPMPTAAIMSPRSYAVMGVSVDAMGQPLRVPEIMKDIRLIPTSTIPNNLTYLTNSDCTEIYVGDFSHMAFMVRETMTLQVLNELYAESGQVGFVGHVRADVAVWYPSAFAVLTDLR